MDSTTYVISTHGTANAFVDGMTQDILEALRVHFGTVSSQTELSGVVAVRNVTAYKRLIALVGSRATVNKLTSNPHRYPVLVRVTEVVE